MKKHWKCWKITFFHSSLVLMVKSEPTWLYPEKIKSEEKKYYFCNKCYTYSSMKWSLQLKIFAHFLFFGHVASLFQSPWAILAESSNRSPCLARHLQHLFNYFPSKLKACASKSNISFSVPIMHNVTPTQILLCTHFSLLTPLELIQLLRKYNFHFHL